MISLHRAVRPLLVPQWATVETAHRRTVNLRLDSGGLVTLCTPELGNGPGCLLVAAPWPLSWLVGERVSVGPRTVCGPGLTVAMAGAAEWEPGAPSSPGPLTVVRQGWHRAKAELCSLAEGRAGLVSVLCRGPAASTESGPVRRADSSEGDAVRNLARAGVCALESRTWSEAVAGLVGLGPGLTPSGDDLLCGFLLLALRAGWAETAAPLRAALKAIPPGRTTPVSESLLDWATEGVANERALHWLDGLLQGAPPPLDPVLAIGATSGADFATGALLALDLLLKEAGG